MKQFLALIHREFLEHRGAFLYAPAIIIAILTVVMLSGVTFGRFSAAQSVGVITGIKGYEIGFLFLSALWFVYLMSALFFYFADAFSADSRNNSMLFWKSMPVSDFKVLASKMTAGITLFPLLVLAAAALSGVVVFIGTVIMAFTVPGFVPASPLGYLGTSLNVLGFDLAYLVLAMLWYAPFFAWVGLLSVLFRRWSIPLAFLLPALAGLAENLVLRNAGPEGGYLLAYLRNRIDFSVASDDLRVAVFADTPFDAVYVLTRFVADIDWVQLSGGVLVAALLVYAASEVRRRGVAA